MGIYFRKKDFGDYIGIQGKTVDKKLITVGSFIVFILPNIIGYFLLDIAEISILLLYGIGAVFMTAVFLGTWAFIEGLYYNTCQILYYKRKGYRIEFRPYAEDKVGVRIYKK